MLEVVLTARVYPKGTPLDRITTKNLIADLGGVSSIADLRAKLSALPAERRRGLLQRA